jgi:hypothetical protein
MQDMLSEESKAVVESVKSDAQESMEGQDMSEERHESEQVTIQQATAELIELRDAGRKLTLRKARLLSLVKRFKLYEDLEGVESFSAYCDKIDYARGYAYKLARVWESDAARQSFMRLGIKRADRVEWLERKLAKAGLDEAEVESEVESFVEYANRHTASDTVSHSKDVLESFTQEADADADAEELSVEQLDAMTLEEVLTLKEHLIERKGDLEKQIEELKESRREIIDALDEIDAKIDADAE